MGNQWDMDSILALAKLISRLTYDKDAAPKLAQDRLEPILNLRPTNNPPIVAEDWCMFTRNEENCARSC